MMKCRTYQSLATDNPQSSCSDSPFCELSPLVFHFSMIVFYKQLGYMVMLREDDWVFYLSVKRSMSEL